MRRQNIGLFVHLKQMPPERWQVFLSIICIHLTLTFKIFQTVGIFLFIFHWNESLFGRGESRCEGNGTAEVELLGKCGWQKWCSLRRDRIPKFVSEGLPPHYPCFARTSWVVLQWLPTKTIIWNHLIVITLGNLVMPVEMLSTMYTALPPWRSKFLPRECLKLVHSADHIVATLSKGTCLSVPDWVLMQLEDNWFASSWEAHTVWTSPVQVDVQPHPPHILRFLLYNKEATCAIDLPCVPVFHVGVNGIYILRIPSLFYY